MTLPLNVVPFVSIPGRRGKVPAVLAENLKKGDIVWLYSSQRLVVDMRPDASSGAGKVRITTTDMGARDPMGLVITVLGTRRIPRIEEGP